MKTTLFISLLAVFLCTCSISPPETMLTVDIGQSVYYKSDNGDHFEARYGSLSDGSLHFVKLKMPDGKEYTLPQAISGSGARYTDDRSIVTGSIMALSGLMSGMQKEIGRPNIQI